ncbi:MAG: P-II family nitrogen regulator [Cyanobacteria bacterium SZAS-4]|nr:P-II family nitrogen regulator [Cyanobacteria bacterium SZAS-4]
MKMVTAIIRPERLQDVKTGLFREGITGMSLSTVLGHGGEQDTIEQYRGSAVVFEFVEKVKIEIAVPNHLVDKTIDTILNAAQTGTVGDGKIFVQSIERVVRIRTGEEDNLALLPVPLTVQTLPVDKA